jgi:hypothetical protein
MQLHMIVTLISTTLVQDNSAFGANHEREMGELENAGEVRQSKRDREWGLT